MEEDKQLALSKENHCQGQKEATDVHSVLMRKKLRSKCRQFINVWPTVHKSVTAPTNQWWELNPCLKNLVCLILWMYTLTISLTHVKAESWAW